MDLSNIILTIDTREQEHNRINAMKQMFEKYGAIVEMHKLDLCDYHIFGLFRDKDIDLGIEAKSLTDFTGSHQDLPDKLMRAYDIYEQVGLFVTTGNYKYTIQDDGHCLIKNFAVQDGHADVLKLAVLENMLGSFAVDGVYVRQLLTEAQFPFSTFNVMIDIVKDVHTGLHSKHLDHRSITRNMLAKIPGIGVKTADKLISHCGSMHWIASLAVDHYIEVLGKKKGVEVYNIINSKELYKNSKIRGGDWNLKQV